MAKKISQVTFEPQKLTPVTVELLEELPVRWEDRPIGDSFEVNRVSIRTLQVRASRNIDDCISLDLNQRMWCGEPLGDALKPLTHQYGGSVRIVSIFDDNELIVEFESGYVRVDPCDD